MAEKFTPPQLPRLRRGSALRNGSSVVASGDADAPVALAASATGTLTLEVIEDCHLDRLFIQVGGAGDIKDLTITSISINNDGLVNHVVPAQMFAADAVGSPRFGHFVTKSSSITIGLANGDGTNAMDVSAAFSAMPVDSQ